MQAVGVESTTEPHALTPSTPLHTLPGRWPCRPLSPATAIDPWDPMSSAPPDLDLPFQYHRLANGLRVVLHRNAALPLVAVNLWYHVGSKNERPGRTGFAHLFEHMLFQGSEN